MEGCPNVVFEALASGRLIVATNVGGIPETMNRALRVFRELHIEVTPIPSPDELHSTENWNGRFHAFKIKLVESVKILDCAVRGWI